MYNVHNLLHIVEDCRVQGPLDNFSVFLFENYLGQIKKLVKQGYLPLQQIANRLNEKSSFNLKNDNTKNSHPVVFKREVKNSTPKRYLECVLHSSQIIVDVKNNCVKLVDGTIAMVEHFYYNPFNKETNFETNTGYK